MTKACVGDPAGRHGRPEVPDLAERRPQHQTRRRGAGELRDNVKRGSLPRELAAQGERDAHDRIQMRS